MVTGAFALVRKQEKGISCGSAKVIAWNDAFSVVREKGMLTFFCAGFLGVKIP